MTRQPQGSERSVAPGEHARMSLALWLRQGRATRGMSIEDVAKITKIQARILEKLETGRFEGLPADVFVRGFVRSFARCVGLDEAEALTRYVACGRGDASGTTAGATARAFVETMSDLAPVAARSAAGPRILRDTTPVTASASAPAIEVVDVQAIDAAADAGAVEVDPSADRAGELDSSRIAEGSARLDVMPALAAGTSESEIVVAEVVAELGDASAATELAADVEVAATAVEAPAKKKRVRKPKATAEGAAVAAPAARKRKKATTVLAPVVADATPEAVADATPEAVADSTPDAVAAVTGELGSVMAESAVESAPSEGAVIDLFAAPTGRSAPIVVEDRTELDISATEDAEVGGLWTPKMPVAQPSAPWRRPAFAAQAVPVTPSIVIDDNDPDSAERELEDRRDAGTRTLRSFLPPILLDREDRSARQGGLTLAVIILLIAATLTLSYLMRRPGSSGDGMTARDVPTQLVG